jgi:hypothetical protein
MPIKRKSKARKIVIDTNVAVNANKAIREASISLDDLACVERCIDVIDEVCKHGGLVIDAGDEIFEEYRKNLSLKGMPGMGDRFMKWVHDKRWSFPAQDRVTLSPNQGCYLEFPSHDGLSSFDPSDRKFVAVAYAHPEKPCIVEATDSKWWGMKDVLADVGIRVEFICEAWIKRKYESKFE